MSSNDLTELKQKRLKWVEANRENGFDEGINRLLTELYPDNAHFIYELLQNAEDPQATEVAFKLTDSAVEFSHNGKRLFEFKDVESITSIGNSTKRDDATSIGKFGVGFKAVFAYTNTPEIHSGDFHFQIHDLVVPETKKVKQTSIGKNKTRFVFPFDNPKKSSVLAANEVEKGLCALGDNTLLFLSHIRKINYSLPDGSQGSLERLDHENGRIEIRAKHPHSETTISHWLHFHKDVDVTDADGNNKNCRVAMAYQLEKVTDKNKESETWKIIPVHGGGQVSIYFPAEKETSKLRFHIHAPFASTVARDSVRDCDDNQQLRDHLAELIVESFTTIRDQEMLIMSFLAVLPTPKDELAEFYEPIRTKIVHAFKTELLTATKSGSHAAAGALYRGSAKISDVIEDEDLSIITGMTVPLWAANAPQRNSHEDNFLTGLEINKWRIEQLSVIFKLGDRTKVKPWFEQKDDIWIMNFYSLLNDADNKSEWERLDFPLVRVESGDQSVKHIIGNKAYFAPDYEHISVPDGIDLVKLTVYIKENTNHDINQSAKNFLQNIGVKPFNNKVAILLRLKRYSSSFKEISNDHYEDIKQFASYLKKNPTEKILFQTVKFLLADSNNKNENTSWERADATCLDNPFVETGLAELFEIHRKKAISKNYFEHLNESERNDFVEFLSNLDVMQKLEVIQVEKSVAILSPNNPYHSIHGSYNWTVNGCARDYSIPELEKYLKAKNVLASKLIWNALINANVSFKQAIFQPNKTYNIITVESQLIYYLKKYAWIPNSTGEFCKPREITREDLLTDFPYNDRNGLLTALELGSDAKKLTIELHRENEQSSSEYQEKDQFAKKSGFESAAEMEDFAVLAQELKEQGMSPDEIRAFLFPPKPDFEDDYSSNPERRVEKVQEAAADAPEKRTEIRERSVSVDDTEVKKAAKSYLKDRYTESSKILYCQICNDPMPFKLSDGSYYFEVVQLIGDTSKRYRENYIALCPTDAAKFQYANPSKDKIGNLVNALIDDRSPDDINDSDDDENSFDIVLAGNTETLQFRRVHLIDLKAVLSL